MANGSGIRVLEDQDKNSNSHTGNEEPLPEDSDIEIIEAPKFVHPVKVKTEPGQSSSAHTAMTCTSCNETKALLTAALDPVEKRACA